MNYTRLVWRKRIIMTKEEFQEIYRHSLAHILAKAVIEIYGKETQYAIGPQVADGCYYDFVLPKAVTEDDFDRERVLKLIKGYNKISDTVSSEIESTMINTDVAYESKVDVNLTFEEVFELFLNEENQ